MNLNLLFDFTADKQKNTLSIIREFAAEKELVWQCFTQQELLDQWFAPAPYIAKTKSLQFKEGGHWHYAMVGPDGTEHWAWTGFITIHPQHQYTCTDAFCDIDGNLNYDLPQAKWVVDFKDNKETTRVEILIQYKSLADLEAIIKMGMMDGMKIIYEQLDQLLTSKK